MRVLGQPLDVQVPENEKGFPSEVVAVKGRMLRFCTMVACPLALKKLIIVPLLLSVIVVVIVPAPNVLAPRFGVPCPVIVRLVTAEGCV
jgi:hypothetical protein